MKAIRTSTCCTVAMLVLAVVSLLLSAPAFAQNTPTGPFGFSKGMTRGQIIALVGNDAVKDSPGHPDQLFVTVAPIPNHVFESYILVISPTQGLLKVVAIGRNIATEDTGSALMLQFNTLVTAVSAKYGQANTHNTCNRDTPGQAAVCDNPHDFMIEVADEQRNVSAYWLNVHINGVVGVGAVLYAEKSSVLTANPTGWITLGYEFEGFDQYEDGLAHGDRRS